MFLLQHDFFGWMIIVVNGPTATCARLPWKIVRNYRREPASHSAKKNPGSFLPGLSQRLGQTSRIRSCAERED
jgi:hypothetical protein